jgi:predicted molibdopterin-dependent oxidoreductase YjgC
MDDRLTIEIDGREVAVAEGTTVAAALLMHGVFDFGPSPGGRRRAPLCGMGSCFECVVTIDGNEHLRACQKLCEAGMKVRRRDD